MAAGAAVERFKEITFEASTYDLLCEQFDYLWKHSVKCGLGRLYCSDCRRWQTIFENLWNAWTR